MFCINTVLPVRGGATISARTAPRGIPTTTEPSSSDAPALGLLL
ncbi:hypothetical protein J2R76_006977 [Bradyrhizobium sp. USDA 4532]|nr:hypothetical protein [Bradyrhizobium sp. USDA 4545]MCP1923386.1 hypothetical protein [Bradyrhizobium sp. USDA 4532]